MSTLDKRTTIKKLEDLERAINSSSEFTQATWETLEGKPSAFPPESHSHEEYATGQDVAQAVSDIPNPTWGDVTGKPSTFPPATHDHDGVYAKPADIPDYDARLSAIEARLDALETSAE